MRLIKNLFASILLLVFAITVTSCSKDLSRDKAKKLIVKNKDLPQTETTNIEKKYYISQYGDRGAFGMQKIGLVTNPNYSGHKRMLDDLASEGLIKVEETKESSNGVHYTWASVALTKKGKKFLMSESDSQYEVKVSEIVFGEITGIQTSKQFKVAEVDYTLERKKITPFGNASQSTTLNRHQNFSLYDDGWRIDY